MPDQVTVFAIVDADAPDMPKVRSAVARLAERSAAEPGCLRYDVHLSTKAPERLILHEVWADPAALEHHRQSGHVAAFKAALDGTSANIWASPFRILT
jgi:quinol monooxygenase YgiN